MIKKLISIISIIIILMGLLPVSTKAVETVDTAYIYANKKTNGLLMWNGLRIHTHMAVYKKDGKDMKPIYLSTGMLEELSKRLINGGYDRDTPAALVYKATWDDEKKFVGTISTLADIAKKNNITKTAIVLVGDAIAHNDYEKSRLYAADFETEFRKRI